MMNRLAARQADSAAALIATAPTPERAVQLAARAAGGLGVPGLFSPGLDEAGMYSIWFAMVTTIAKRSGAEVSAATVAKLVSAALAGAAAYSLGSKVLTWGVIAVGAAAPFATVPAAIAMNVGLNAYLTRRLGRRCIARFSDPRFSARDVLDLARGLTAGSAGSHITETPGAPEQQG
jgi:hypothetical protein